MGLGGLLGPWSSQCLSLFGGGRLGGGGSLPLCPSSLILELRRHPLHTRLGDDRGPGALGTLCGALAAAAVGDSGVSALSRLWLETTAGTKAGTHLPREHNLGFAGGASRRQTLVPVRRDWGHW